MILQSRENGANRATPAKRRQTGANNHPELKKLGPNNFPEPKTGHTRHPEQKDVAIGGKTTFLS